MISDVIIRVDLCLVLFVNGGVCTALKFYSLAIVFIKSGFFAPGKHVINENHEDKMMAVEVAVPSSP